MFLDTHACVGEFGVASWASTEAGKPGRETGNIFLAISVFHKYITGGLHLAASERKTDVAVLP